MYCVQHTRYVVEHQSAPNNVQNVGGSGPFLVSVIRLTFRIASLQSLHRSSHIPHSQFLVLLRVLIHTEYLLNVPLELIIRFVADQNQFGQILG